jgi:Tol biopolymer transport system component
MGGLNPSKSHGRTALIRSRPAALACVGAMVLVLLGGCSSSNSQPFHDTPVIGNLFPSNATAGGPEFTLNITGTGFIAQSTVFWNNTQLTATFNATTLQLSATVPASDIASPGVAQVIVVSPAPGGGMSNAVTFRINPVSNPVPTIASLSPSSTPVCSPPTPTCSNVTITITGTNFISSSTAQFNGNSRTTTFVSSTQVTVSTIGSDVATNTTISVTVSNPAPGGGVSNAASFVVGTGKPAVRLKGSAMASGIQFPQVISLNALGGASNGLSSTPAISADGRFVAFYSTATNLVAGGPSGNIFVRDTCVGATDCAPQTIAVDVAADGGAPNRVADAKVAIGDDGRFVAFASRATNLIAGGATGSGLQVYLRDLCLGSNVPNDCVSHTQLVSIDVSGNISAGANTSPSISEDGRFVAFAGGGIFMRDTCAASVAINSCVPKTYAVSTWGGSAPGDGFAHPAISADGRYVTFVAKDPAAPNVSAVLLADMCLGSNALATCEPSLMKVSVTADGGALAGVNDSPSISADGRFVAFESQRTGSAPEVFLRDTCLAASVTGTCTASTTLISPNASAPSISAVGRYVSYIAVAAADSGTNASSNGLLHVYDTCFGAPAGCTPQVYPVNISSGASKTTAFTVDAPGFAPMSSDGSVIVFSSSAVMDGLPLSGQGDVLLSIAPF